VVESNLSIRGHCGRIAALSMFAAGSLLAADKALAVPAAKSQIISAEAANLERTVRARLAKGVSYFIIPHPDDEVAAWSLVQRAKYPVFVLMTQGERSAYCNDRGGKGSQSCKQDRLRSWDGFLNTYYAKGRAVKGQNFTAYVDKSSARVVFDLGDGRLTEQAVTDAINQARRIGVKYGSEQYVVSANIRYGHSDHEAVFAAVQSQKGLGRLAVNGSIDPTSNFTLPINGINGLMACPNGSVNQQYRWLNNGKCWSTSNDLNQVFRVAPRQSLVDLDALYTNTPVTQPLFANERMLN
jgi:hypothetical protein